MTSIHVVFNLNENKIPVIYFICVAIAIYIAFPIDEKDKP
jgi:hypothetical protein